MSRYSGFGPASTSTVRGSSAMPQIGQSPGASRTISGCIGQVHSVLVAGAAGSAGSSAMPHFGQAPAWSLSTSGSIGQIHFVPAGTSAGSGRGLPPSQASGSASNFSLQCSEQKWIVSPRCSERIFDVATSTVMPQTGSSAVSPAGAGPG